MTTANRRENDLTRFYQLFPFPQLARDLFNIAEGYRIDVRLRAAYPGIRREMEPIRAASLERRPSLVDLPEIPAIVESLLQHALGAELVPEELPPTARETAATAIGVLGRLGEPEASVARTAEVCAELYEILDDHAARRLRSSDEDDPGEASQQPQGADQQGAQEPSAASEGSGIVEYQQVDMPPFMSPVLEELMKRVDLPRSEEITSPETPPDPDGAMESSEKSMQSGQVSDDGDQLEGDTAQAGEGAADDEQPSSASDAKLSEDETPGGGQTPESEGAIVAQGQEEPERDLGEQTFLYDEWDHRIEDYRPAWCTVREQRLTRVHEAFVAATFHEFGGIVTQIRRNFQLMRPERLRKMRFQSEGDDLDLDGLVEHVVDKRARVTPTERVYIKRDKKDRDVTTAFLIDMSSSTDRKIDSRKRIMDIEKESLLLMCEALEAIRDEYAIYGFSGNGRDDCQFYVVKELGERYDDRVKARIGGIYARQKTRMGPAIRHATKRLMGVDSNVKLMILVTDGKPYDSDTYQDNLYAQEDTKMALREARREKIHLFCVTVDTEAADYLPTMYSDANFVIIDDVKTLPHRLPQLYRRLTT